jgi:hypothetical protein
MWEGCGAEWQGQWGRLSITLLIKKEMAELTNQVSNGPDSFFNSKTVVTGGRDDGC